MDYKCCMRRYALLTYILTCSMKNILGNKNKVSNIPLRISMIYALAGCLWIIFSDAVLSLVITDAAVLTRLQTSRAGYSSSSLHSCCTYLLTAMCMP